MLIFQQLAEEILNSGLILNSPLDWFRAFKNPRENAVWAKFRRPQNENETEIRKNGPASFRYLPILYESLHKWIAFETSH